MSILAFVIFPTGEPYTRQIFKWMYDEYKVIDIIRRRTTNLEIYRQEMTHMYTQIAPSKMAKANAKIEAQGLSSSFLVVVVEGYKGDNGSFKKKVRKFTGLNCIHSADNPESVKDHVRWLLGNDVVIDYNKRKEIDLDNVYDFLHWEFRNVGSFDNRRFAYLSQIFDVLEKNDINYVVSNFGIKLFDNVFSNNKDIEILCSERARAVDTLGAVFYSKPGMKKPHLSTYLVEAIGRTVKLDFSLGVMIPKKWRDHILATRFRGREGHYVPLDRDVYWLTMFERVIYKPRKWKDSVQHKYAPGAKKNDLITWGINMGIHDQIRKGTSLEDCQKAVRRYIDEL